MKASGFLLDGVGLSPAKRPQVNRCSPVVVVVVFFGTSAAFAVEEVPAVVTTSELPPHDAVAEQLVGVLEGVHGV